MPCLWFKALLGPVSLSFFIAKTYLVNLEYILQLKLAMRQMVIKNPHGKKSNLKYVYIIFLTGKLQFCVRGESFQHFSFLPRPYRQWGWIHDSIKCWCSLGGRWDRSVKHLVSLVSTGSNYFSRTHYYWAFGNYTEWFTGNQTAANNACLELLSYEEHFGQKTGWDLPKLAYISRKR